MRGAAYDKIPLKTRKSYKKIAPPYGMIFLAEKINREKTAGREIHMARKIVVTSGKGGVGKTTVAANLGAQLSRRGERVILCDTDFGLNNMDVVTGVENLVVYDIVDVIEGRCRAKQALIRHPDFGNLYILAAGGEAGSGHALSTVRFYPHRLPRGDRRGISSRRRHGGRGNRRHHAAHFRPARRGQSHHRLKKL